MPCMMGSVFGLVGPVELCWYTEIHWKLKSLEYSSFSYQAPVVWNSLPTDLKFSPSLASSKSKLKMHFVQEVLLTMLSQLSQFLRFRCLCTCLYEKVLNFFWMCVYIIYIYIYK